MEIYSENSKFYIRRKCGYSGKKSSRSWVEWFTQKGLWSEDKMGAAEFQSQEDAERAAPRVVLTLDERFSRLEKILKVINDDQSGDFDFVKYQIKKIMETK